MAVNKKKFRFWLILSVIWITIIFAHSAMPSEISRQESLGILSWITRFLPKMSHHTLRKLGHMVEFCILGLLFTGCFWRYGDFRLRKPMLGCLTVAFLDETLQLFVSGRSGEVRDIWIDLAGALCGTLLMWIVFKIRKK